MHIQALAWEHGRQHVHPAGNLGTSRPVCGTQGPKRQLTLGPRGRLVATIAATATATASVAAVMDTSLLVIPTARPCQITTRTNSPASRLRRELLVLTQSTLSVIIIKKRVHTDTAIKHVSKILEFFEGIRLWF